MGMGYTCMQMEQGTKVTGRMTCKMVMALKLGLMDPSMRDITQGVRNMDKVHTLGTTGQPMKENGWTIR